MLELIFQSQKKMQEMYQYEEEGIVNEFERMSEKKNPHRMTILSMHVRHKTVKDQATFSSVHQ